MLRFPGALAPGHITVAPPGQSGQRTFFDGELTLKFSLRDHPQSLQEKPTIEVHGLQVADPVIAGSFFSG
ncbi:MAG: hypothetical protein AB7H80_01930 [Candidatus Kapaibacterium sp.]